MGHDRMVVFLDALVGRTLAVVPLSVLAMFLSHGLLNVPATFALEFGHCPIVVA